MENIKLIYFYLKTCKECRRQEEEFEKHPPRYEMRRVEAYSEAGPPLMRKYRVTDVPTTVIVDECDRLIHMFIDFHTTTDIEDWIARR